MSPFIYALDFDGVICDSVEESSKTALMAAKSQWPHLALPSTCADDFPPQLLSALCVVRPVVETGFEYVLLARLCAEIKADCLDEEFVQPVLRDWATLRDEAMERWDVSRDDLVNTFGSARDRWIAQDEDSWAVSNKIFPGVCDAINFSVAPIFIITTKEARFCKLLLSRNGLSVPEDRVFGLGSGSKISVLKRLFNMPEHSGRTICFVEDRYETLEKVSLSLLGLPLQLYLASWGYNTQATRSEAEDHPFIDLIDLPTFVTKFQ